MTADLAPVSPRGLRRDAAENRSRILDAARASFDEEGLDVGIDVIAARAGVGVGTVYRRFPSKEDLIAAVLDEIVGTIRDSMRTTLAGELTTEEFMAFLLDMGQLQFDHAGCLSRLWTIADDDVRAELHDLGCQLLERAQRTGAVRDDLVYEDITVFLWSLRGIIERTALVAPETWRRHLELFAQSLAPGGAPLAASPMSFAEAEVVSKNPRR